MRRSAPQLELWHTLRSDESTRLAKIETFDQYLAYEGELFAAAERRLRSGVELPALSRFDSESPTSALAERPNWNRSYVLEASEPIGGAVLLHGLSDSPYSLRSVAQLLHSRGYTVIGPRLPGHGLYPGALAGVSWRDWRRVTDLAVEELERRLPAGTPRVLVGYSNGAGLALDWTIRDRLRPREEAATGPPRPERIVLLSPALAVSGAARFGPLLTTLGHLPTLEALAWQDVLPEYDPYKYNSFPVRAGTEIHRLIQAVEVGFQRLERQGRLDHLPPILTLQSAVDATVPPISSLERLYGRLHGAESELVLFDANRRSSVDTFLSSESRALLTLVDPETPLPFTATLVTNESRESDALVAITRRPDGGVTERKTLGVSWPEGIYSLSHVAIPFPPTDPVYGREQPGGLSLGGLEVKGERDVLVVPFSLLSRLRFNPFYGYLEERIVEFLDLPAAVASETALDREPDGVGIDS